MATAETTNNNHEQNVNLGIRKSRFSIRFKLSIAVISMVSAVILVMTYYFVQTESNILKKSILQSAEREIFHLDTIAVESLSSGDDLPLISAVSNLKNLNYVKYVYVLDLNGEITHSLDQESLGKSMTDANVKKILEYSDATKALLITIPDLSFARGEVYDFSLPVLHKVRGNRLATVRIGFSNKFIIQEIARVTQTIVMIAMGFLLFAILAILFVSKVIIQPVKKLTKGAAIIGKGNLDFKIDVKSRDEIGVLADTFNMMTSQLKEARDLEIESRIMQEQLDLAREIQEGLNPMGFYNKKGIQIKGFTRAAKGVGGDYFDYIDIDENRVGALISDVSGKGVPASLVMVMIRTVFVTSIKRKDIDCATIVRAINDSLSTDFAIDKFATLFFMIYDRSTGEISFANAGHGPLFCYRAKKKSCTITKLDGVPIGITDAFDYEQAKVKLEPGDFVVLYTDGVSEMRNMEKEEYGRNRLMDLVIANSSLNAKEIVDKIVDDVLTFKSEAPQHDDMTTLVFKRVE